MLLLRGTFLRAAVTGISVSRCHMEHKADGGDAGGDLPGEDAAPTDGRQRDESGLGAVLRGLGERIVVELHPHSTPSSSLAIHLHFCQLRRTRALPTALGPPMSSFLGRGRCG